MIDKINNIFEKFNIFKFLSKSKNIELQKQIDRNNQILKETKETLRTIRKILEDLK